LWKLVSCGLARDNLIASAFPACSHGPHPSPVARAVIKKIKDILALEPEPDFLAVPPAPGRNRFLPPSALIFEHVAILLLEDRAVTCEKIRLAIKGGSTANRNTFNTGPRKLARAGVVSGGVGSLCGRREPHHSEHARY
jgi:hypothetical protein